MLFVNYNNRRNVMENFSFVLLMSILTLVSAIFGYLKSQEFKGFTVQSTHLFHMEQHHDLTQHTDAINPIKIIRDKSKPLNRIALCRLALATVRNIYPYHENFRRAVKPFARDTAAARSKETALVYKGHGNEAWPVYTHTDLETLIRKADPDINTFTGCVDGYSASGATGTDLLRLAKL